jgi:hypothetical protein
MPAWRWHSYGCRPAEVKARVALVFAFTPATRLKKTLCATLPNANVTVSPGATPIESGPNAADGSASVARAPDVGGEAGGDTGGEVGPFEHGDGPQAHAAGAARVPNEERERYCTTAVTVRPRPTA